MMDAGFRILKGCSEQFPLQVVDRDGLPHLLLTTYARLAKARHAPRTATAYIRELVAFASWVSSDAISMRQGWSLMGSPTAVRALVGHFLARELSCVIAHRMDKLGVTYQRVEPRWGSTRSVHHVLAALRSFYSILRDVGLYVHEQPMDGDGARERIVEEQQRWIESFQEKNGRMPMPAASGVDHIRHVRQSAAYFRLHC